VVPGCSLCPLRRSPAGDPIYEIDGTVLAMRRETACCLLVKRSSVDAA
jgi:Fe2+ transport system protein FeoA